MNPNYTPGAEQEPDTQDPNEGGESEMLFSTADYPELEGLQAGNPVKVTCEGTVSKSENGMVTLSVNPGSCQFETEGQADKSMRQMSQQDNAQPAGDDTSGEDF